MVSPFGNVPAGAGPCCARVELSGWAVLHPLHRGMQTPIPVSQRLPLSSPVNTEIFIKSGAPPAPCSKTSWASPVTSGLLQKSQWPPPSLAGFQRAVGVPAAGAGGFFQWEEAGWERGGETGAAGGRGACDATISSVPPWPWCPAAACKTRCPGRWSGNAWVWVAFRARRQLRKGI